MGARCICLGDGRDIPAAGGRNHLDVAPREGSVMKLQELLQRYRVEGSRGFRLAHRDASDGGGLARNGAEALLAEGQKRLADLQDRLFAQDRWALLVLLQGMDASGKDGTIRHVFNGVNPQGVEVTSFKSPSALELDHDFLWRHAAALPRRGHIAIHNRSWYEEVLVARVHPAVLARQKLPPTVVDAKLFEHRLEDIAAFERYLARQGILVLKFFLHISLEEQRRRFLSRIQEPAKHWKFNPADVAERRHWVAYHKAYEQAIRATATPHAPWYVVPADSKPFTRLVVAAAIEQALTALKLRYPEPGPEDLTALAQARAALG
jgi:PPK2 family polyphosphate:nucleotide phosphotransferase